MTSVSVLFTCPKICVGPLIWDEGFVTPAWHTNQWHLRCVGPLIWDEGFVTGTSLKTRLEKICVGPLIWDEGFVTGLGLSPLLGVNVLARSYGMRVL